MWSLEGEEDNYVTWKLKLKGILSYVTAVYGQKWWLGYDLEQNEEMDEFKITFIHPCGPDTSYPRHANVLRVSVVDVLTKVEMSNKNQRRPKANNIQQILGALRCNPPAWVNIQMSRGCAARQNIAIQKMKHKLLKNIVV